ncbi:MAG: hypothetical protein Q9165_005564 [Trypethelium subeluteriae]
MTPPIAILGAGPSGLALGRLLYLANIAFVIFERDETPNKTIGQGGTLDIHPGSGQLALKEAGLLDQFKSLARCEVSSVFADAKGTIHAKFGGGGDADRPEIDRRDLRALLINSIPADKVRWGLRVQHVQGGNDGSMSVHFADGSIESGFRLVVGADGAWSKARSLITSAKPQYSGLHYLTTSIKVGNPLHAHAASLAGRGNYLAVGGEKQIATQKLGDDSYYVAIGLRLPENWSRENSALLEDSSSLRQSLLNEYFADWPQVHTNLIKHSEGDFHAWPLNAMPVDSLSWEAVPGVTLIGDAAHVSTPFVGEGVNCAMHDSLQLAQQIAKHGLDDLDLAVSEYEKLMFPRAVDLITRSSRNGELLFAPDAPRGFLQAFCGIDQAESENK